MKMKLLVCGLCVVLGVGASRAEITIVDTPSKPATPANPVPPPKPDSTTEPAKPVVDGDVLKFMNGDALHGTILAAGPTGGVRWRRGDVKEPIAFDFANVAEIALAPRTRAATAPKVAVELTNGDRLQGELTTLDDKALTLKTWYAGAVAVKRAVLQRLTFLTGTTDAVYTGPNNIDEWKSDGNRGGWTFRKGALYGNNGSIGRDVKLPDVGNIEFDLAWRGQLYVQIGFGFEDVRQIYNSGGYMVQMSYTQIYLQRYRARNGSSGYVGSNVEMQELQRKTKLHASIRINKPKKLVALYLDGNLVKQWNETDEWCAKGTGLVFVGQGQGQVRISNLSVSTWDGRLDTEGAATAKEADLVRLNNGDKVSGTVKSVSGGQAMLSASFADMNVPLERINSIEFASQKSERARRNPNDCRAVFPDGGRLTFGLDKLDEQNLTGSSENFGKITAALGGFRKVQFHIYDKAADSGEEDEWGGPATGGMGEPED